LYNNVNSFIFSKKINSDYKLVPFKVSVNDIGRTKYLPPVSKEWKNSVYNYNSNILVNYPVNDLKINSLIKSYFNLYFNPKFLNNKYISRKKKSKSYNKIYVSKAEIKHTNSKAIVTIYVYNREGFILSKIIRKLKKNIFTKLMILSLNKNKLMKFLSLPWIIKSKNWKDSSVLWRLANYGGFLSISLSSGLGLGLAVKDNYNKVDSTLDIRMRRLAKILYEILVIIRGYKLRLSLNKYKFEEIFLKRLSKLISKYYGKKVEFNIVNQKSITFNGDIFTEILTNKIKNKTKKNPSIPLNSILKKVRLPYLNSVIERGRLEKTVDLKLIDNKYKNLNVSSILHNNNSFNYSLNKLIYNIYYENTGACLKKESKLTVLPNQDHIRDIVLDNIKYKIIGGVKLRVKGRLTRRYRADRAIFKLRIKGGLKNIDSAFKGLSSVVYRGYLDSNVEKSLLSSQRRIGAFAVKGWFSGK